MATITRLEERRTRRRQKRATRRKGKRPVTSPAEILVLPPRVIADLSDLAYGELVVIAQRDGISPSDAAARLLEECLVEESEGAA
ncbi:hypothetical protein [Methyloceanibacter caenitepidi]|uniref:Uncharacterized protein n=1 Tax=Methyloceanibacter caenitepidi TaxID=1384459 RepID=A0A0A8K1W8_9HYPH|nr:hypothetical protein [Methyloceanibacter caenitepidi]BAQ16948.1 hypothetical protein GL4_1492 [Methyloceanibacter caenitepidi]